jgi:hypothetical protein
MPWRGNKTGRSAPPDGSEAGLKVCGGARRESETPSEVKLLRALIDRSSGSSLPSQVDVERGIERGVGRLMLLELRLRERASRAGGTLPREGMCEDHALSEEIRAIRGAVTELRAHMNSWETSPLAHGFVIARGPALGGGSDPLMDGPSPVAGRDGAGARPRQRACAAPAVERHAGR